MSKRESRLVDKVKSKADLNSRELPVRCVELVHKKSTTRILNVHRDVHHEEINSDNMFCTNADWIGVRTNWYVKVE